jgi:hypothetical protein
MKEKFSAESTNLDQPSASKNGAPNEATDTAEAYESEPLDIERSSAIGPDKDKTNLSSLTATGPRTPTRLPRKPGANRNPSGPPKDLPISGSCADLAGKLLPETLRTELNLEDGATFGDALAAVLFAAAIKGNIRAAREIREAIEGRANQRSNRVAAEPIEVLVKYEPPLSQMMPKDSPDAPNE